MKILREERGNVLVLTTLCLAILLPAFMAMAIDVGNLFYTQRKLQSLADAAAMAGALEISACGGTSSSSSSCTVMKTAVTTALTEGGSPTPTLFVQCAPASGTGLLLTINNGPCALSGDPNNGLKNYVEVVVTEQIPAYFARFFGYSTLQASARAEAGYAIAPVAGPSGSRVWSNTVYLNGGNIKDGTGYTGGVYANSEAFADSGNINAPYSLNKSGSIQGNCYNNNGCGTKPTKGTAQPNPFSSLTEPSSAPPASPTNASPYDYNAANPVKLQPGTYSGMNFNGSNYTVNFAPGLYYFTGALNGGTNVTFAGDGVTLFFTGNGSLTTNTTLNMTLTPPTAAQIAANATAYDNCTSCADMSIWQSSTDSSTMLLDSGLNLTMKGNIYAPDAEIRMQAGSSGSITTTKQIVSNQLTLNSGTITINSNDSGGGGGGAANGATTISLAE
jgi:Flp pilus assembly protein TadG